MKKKIVLLSLIIAVLLPVSAQTTSESSSTDETILSADSSAIVVDEMDPEITVADTAPVNGIDTLSEQSMAEQLSGKEYGLDADLYRHYHGPDIHFLKNTTNDAIKL